MDLSRHGRYPFLESGADAAQTELLWKFDPPKSWGDIETLLRHYSDETWELFERFGSSARNLLFGSEGLNPEQKAELWVVGYDACIAFCTANDPGKFPPPTEDDMARAWASVLEGRELAPAPKKEIKDAP